MTKNFENRRNEFMQNLRSELIRKSSIIPTSETAITSDKLSSIKLPSLKQMEIARQSFSRYRNSMQGQQNSISSDAITSIDFNRNLKNLIGVKNLRKVKALFMSRDGGMRASIYDPSQIEMFRAGSPLKIEDAKTSLHRFKKIGRIVVIIIRLINMHKVSKEKIKKFGDEIKIEIMDDNIFDPRFYVRPHEPAFSDEAKKMLGVLPSARTEDMLRYIMISLNFSVPEFSELPLRIQRMWAQLAFYQEFEPDRVIVRQGHFPTNYYMIVSGKAMVIEASTSWVNKNSNDEDALVYTPLLTLKRGDCFGELAIINNSKRTSSIKVSGSKSLGLLCVDKEDFFRIQGSKSSRDKLKFLKTSVPLLNQADYPFDALEADNKKTVQVCFSIYYRNGVVISECSQLDEWLYIVKTGSCKLVKRLKLNSAVVNAFWDEQELSKREENLKKIEFMFDMDKYATRSSSPSLFVRRSRGNSKGADHERRRPSRRLRFGVDQNGERQVYLELSKMKEGDVFGLNDTIFDRELDDYKCSMMLISEGVECVQISRRSFLKHLSPQAWFKLRVSSPILPNDQYFIDKYFNSFVWKDYKKKSISAAYKEIEKRETNKFK